MNDKTRMFAVPERHTPRIQSIDEYLPSILLNNMHAFFQ